MVARFPFWPWAGLACGRAEFARRVSLLCVGQGSLRPSAGLLLVGWLGLGRVFEIVFDWSCRLLGGLLIFGWVWFLLVDSVFWFGSYTSAVII